MTAQTVVVDGTHVPWKHLWEIAVTGPLANGEPRFSVRLDDTRSCPEVTPGPDGFLVRQSAARRYDPAKLRATLWRFAPAQVTLSGQ